MSSHVTIQVLEGLERGRVYGALPLPVSIGREEENTVRLNDDRVSRFHAKMQANGDRVILTDLGSTNGTRVNGRPVQVRLLRPGDQVTIGRCLLLYGSPDQIAASGMDSVVDVPREEDSWNADSGTGYGESAVVADRFENSGNETSGGTPAEAYDPEWATPPAGLDTLQTVELSEMLGHVHEQLARLIASAREVHPHEDDPEMHLSRGGWQRLLRLEMDLAVALRKILDPDGEREDG